MTDADKEENVRKYKVALQVRAKMKQMGPIERMSFVEKVCQQIGPDVGNLVAYLWLDLFVEESKDGTYVREL